MNKILSWKITGGVYAYIYPVNNGNYISNRIAEDSPIWQNVIAEISGWNESEYKSHFDKMAAEVQTKYGYSLEYDSKFFGFVDENAIGGVNIVLLSGKDGEGIGGGGNGLGTGPGSEVYEEFNNAIDAKLQEVREDIEKQNEDVKEYVEKKVTETILDAKETISETKKELKDVREELEGKLESARDALDKAANLFNTAEGGIDPEAIKDALSSVREYGNWLETYSGDITTLKTDYDAANQKMGSIGEAENVTDGLFARFATSLNVVSGVVGNVESWMVASSATIGNMASWYDTIESSATEAISFINASAGVISNAISYIKSDEFGNELTTKLERTMDAKDAAIRDKIMAETGDALDGAITNVTRDMEALSGTIEDTIVRLDKTTGDLTSLGQRMDASQQEIEEWMTITDSAMSMAYDMRESWSVESGKLSTVANLIAQTDDEGNVLYFVSAATGEEIPVFITDEFSEETGERIYTTNADGSGYKYYEPSVYTKLSNDVVSYIQQTASAITLSVTNADAITAAIKLAIKEDAEGDKAIISMVADEVIIDADVIAKAISAKTANIGGIIMGNGVIQSMAQINGKPYFYLDGTDGKLCAQNAEIKGSISADTGYIGGLEMGDNMLKAIDGKKETRYYVISSCVYSSSTNTLYFDFRNYITYDEVVKNHSDKKIFAVSYKDKNGTSNKLTIKDETGNKSYYKFTSNDAFSTTEFGILSVEYKNNGNNKQTYALISSSDYYEDDDKGKLVIGVGPTDSGCGINYYYEYTLKTDDSQTERIKIETIYLKKHYSLENGDKKDIYIDAYTYDNGVMNEITGYTFQYSYETFAESGDGITSGYSPAHGKVIYYKDWVYAKSIASSILDGLNYSVPSPYASNDEIVLGAMEDYRVNHKVQVDFNILNRDDSEVGGGSSGSGSSGSGSGSSGSGSSGSGSNTGVTDTGDKGSLTVDVGGNLVSYPYMGMNKFYIMDNPTRIRFWGGNLRSDAIIRSVMIVGTYDYSGNCVKVDTTDFNTKIYEDGTLVTKNIMSEDGFFGGEINSTGTFSGELKNATGTLKNVSITADTINTSLVVSDGKSINAVSESNAYFRVNDNEVVSGAESETWTIDSFTWDKQNKNGTNAGKTYTEEKILLKTTIQNNAKVTIPSMSGYIKRYAPRKKTNNRGSVYVNAYFLSDDNVTTRIFNTMIDVPAFKGSGSYNIDFTTPSSSATYTNTNEKGGYLIIEFGMQIHLSTYSWLGMDKAAGHVYFNTNTSKVDIEYVNKNKDGVHIGKNGMRAEGNLYLYSPNGTYGIEITDSGVKIIKNGTPSDL